MYSSLITHTPLTPRSRSHLKVKVVLVSDDVATSKRSVKSQGLEEKSEMVEKLKRSFERSYLGRFVKVRLFFFLFGGVGEVGVEISPL